MNSAYPDIIDDLPRELKPAVQAQTRLGWVQVYKGRFSNHWAKAIDQLHPSLPLAGCTVVVLVMKHIWQYILDIWKLRNQHLHNDKGHVNIPDYRRAVQTLFEQRHQVPPAAQEAIFHRPIAEILALPPAAIREWIIRSQKYFQQQLRAAKTRAKLNTSDIRTFFQVTPPQATGLQPPLETLLH